MHPSERRHERERRRRMRQQRKQYYAEERRSIRREKQEIRRQKAIARKRIRDARWNAVKKWINRFFQRKSEKSFTRPPDLYQDNLHKKQYLGFKWDVNNPPAFDNTAEEKYQQKEKRKLLKKQQKEFLAQEKKSIKREKQLRKKKIAKMRKKINAARFNGFVNDLKKTLKNPLGTRDMDESDKIILRKIKRDIRRRNYQRISEFPKKIFRSISRFWQKRYKQMANLRNSIFSFYMLWKTAFSQRELREGYIKTFINSLALFLLSFLLVYYIHQFATILTARAFNIPTKLYSYRIDWPLYTYSYLYTRKALIIIFGMGPLLCLLMGIGAYRLFLRIRFRTGFFKSFLLWTAFHAINLFFGAYIVGVITRTGFVYTSEWLFLSNVFDVEEIVFMIVSVIVLLIAGYYSTKQFLYSSHSAAIIEPKFRILYIISNVLFPWLAGTLILYGVNIPTNPLELVMLYGTSSLIIFPIFSNYNTTTMQMLKLPSVPRKLKLGWIFIILTVLAIISTRLLLQSGISFY